MSNDTTSTATNATENTGNVSAATEAEQARIDAYRAAESEVVELATATLDPKDMLKKYAKLGKAVLSLAAKRKGDFKAWTKDDFAKVCDDLATLVKMRVAIREVEMDKYARIYLWVEAVKPLVPSVDKLSYYQVKNKFLPTLAFDAVELSGEIKSDWLTFVRTTVERQIGDDPLSIKDLDAAIADQKKAIEAARNARLDPEKALLREQKAAEAKAKKERRDAQQGIMDAIDGAVTNGHADPNDVVQIVEQALKSNNLSLPAKVVGFDPINCTMADVKMLAQAMIGAGKLAEAKVLRDTLDAMIKVAEHAMLDRAAS
jgi:hypothetical protein